MADFFSSRLLRWLTVAATAAAVMTLASKPFYTVADRILGSQFLEDIAEFFIALPDDVRRASSSGPRPSTRILARPAHDLRAW